jgi:UrcA family protein
MNFLNISSSRRTRRGPCVAASLALGVAAATFGAAASAQEQPPRSVIVNVRDLDTQTPAGAAKLMRRIESAANTVCGDRFVLDLSQHRQFYACRSAAVGRAVQDANLPMLNALARRPADSLTVAGR